MFSNTDLTFGRRWTFLHAATMKTATSLAVFAPLLAGALLAGPAWPAVDVRVESRPIAAPIDAYVRVTDGKEPVTGLVPADFAVTIDDVAAVRFTLVLPPSQDSTQRLSIVIVMKDDRFSTRPDYSRLIEQLEIGDLVSIVKYWGDIESSRYGGTLLLPFTEIDEGAGSKQLNEFIQGEPPDNQSGTPRFLFDGLLSGLSEFETAAAILPDGPKAILTVDCCGGRQSLSTVIASANAGSIPVFNAGYADWDTYPEVVASIKALAENTGGVSVRVAAGAPVRDVIATMASLLKDGYRLAIPKTAVVDCDPHMLNVTVRGESTSVPFARCDTTPEPFELAELSDAPVATEVTSNAVAITGIETAAPVTVFDGEYSIGCGSAFTSEPGWILPGESVCVRHTTAAAGGLEVATLLIVGAESDWFVSSTIFSAPLPTEPPPPIVDGDTQGGGGALGLVEILFGLGALFALQRRRAQLAA